MKKAAVEFITLNTLIYLAEFLVDSFATIYLIQKGVDFGRIGFLWAIYLGITALTDYPTGGFSDKYGRKTIYSLGVFLTSVSYYIILSDQYYILVISYILKGIANSFISGSFTAWLSASLKDSKDFQATISTYKLISTFASLLLAMWIYFNGVSNVDYLFAICASIYLLVGIIVTVALKENYGSQESIRQVYKNSILVFIKNHSLLYMCVINVFVYLFFSIYYFVWQPISEYIFTDIRILPVLYCFYSMASGIGAFLLNRSKWNDYSRLLPGVIILFLASFVLFTVSNSYILPLAFCVAMIIFGFSSGIVFMIINSMIETNAPPEYVTSFFSLVSSISTFSNIVFQILLGFLMNHFGLIFVLIFGIIVSISLLPVLYSKK